MINIGELWACEYSYDQDAFHIEPLKYAIETSWEFIARNETDSYMLIGLFENREDAEKCVIMFREKILIPTITKNGGEWECCRCIWRNKDKYRTQKDICSKKQENYSCMEMLEIMKTNADRLHATCLNCIHFDCAEDENSKCIEPYCEKWHDGIDDRTPVCTEFERWSVKRQIEKSSKYENSWWKEIK